MEDAFSNADEVWAKIGNRLDKVKPALHLVGSQAQELAKPAQGRMVPIKWLWGMAASFLLVMTTSGMFVANYMYNQSQMNVATASPAQTTVSGQSETHALPADFVEAEEFYSRQIALSVGEIQKFTTSKPTQEQALAFLNDVKVLEDQYEVLKNEILEEGNLEQVTAAMVRNLQIRIELLNRQLTILQNIETQKNENENGKVDV
jgi:hypothetical protein